jgi:hypothetical protein
VFILKVLASVAFMAIVLFTSDGRAAWWLQASGPRKAPAVLGLVALGAAAYGACLFAFGFRRATSRAARRE